MKKLVMVMCFALCASLTFAQTKRVTPHVAPLNQNMVAQKADNGIKAAKKDYKASIFSSKAAGDIIASWDFAEGSNNYTTGVIGSGQTIMGEDGSSINMIQHTQTNGHAEWNRVTLADIATYRTTPVDAGGYPVTYDLFEYINYTGAQTPDNGFMVMTMADQIAGWGGSGVVGNFDSYVAFDAVSTSGIGAVLMYFYQAYRCFNSDQNFIDYSTNGTTWYQYEINVRGVDVSGNSWLAGQKKIMLPAICGNQANLYLRIRWACDNNYGGGYGHIWMFDDVSLVEPEANDVALLNSQYYTGLYHQVPQNMDVPITWWASLRNMGTNNQANVTLTLNHLTADSNTMSQVAALSYGPLNVTVQVDTAIDGHGYDTDNGWYVPGNTNRINNAAALYPTANEGDHFIVASYEATNYPKKYQDTIFYQVNALQPSPDGNGQVAVWAMDNGILTPSAYCIDGMDQWGVNWYLSDGLGDNNPSYTKPGYNLWNRFVTGSTVPDNWVIRGMQLVAATQYSATNASQNVTIATGAHITASLYKDSIGAFFKKKVETGALTYETTIDDYNYYYLDGTELGRVERDANGDYPAGTGEYMLPGEYNVINIMFPEQPELEPRTSYHLGYELIDGFFAVAGQRDRYVHHYDGDPADSLYYVYFSSDTLKDGSSNALRKYGRTFHPGHEQNQVQYDPDYGYRSRGSSDFPPMIRMLVGPKYNYPTFNVSVECEGRGVDMAELAGTYVAYNGSSVCGQTVEMTQGSTISYTYGAAEPGYVVLEVYVDGTLVYKRSETITHENVTHSTSSNYDLVYYNFSGYTTNATIKYVFGMESAIEYTINAVSNNDAWGTVSGGGTYQDGEVVTLIANPVTGYHFKQWQDGNINNPRTVTVIGDATYTAYFEQDTPSYHIDVVSADPTMGSTTGSGDYPLGTSVTITATPNTGYHFTQWLDGNTDNPRTVVCEGNATYIAYFAQDLPTYHIDVVSVDPTMGSATGSGDYAENTSVTISAIPNSGYHFVRWGDNNTDNPRTVVCEGNATYIAYFEQDIIYHIDVVSADPTMGSAMGSGDYAENSSVTISAIPNSGYHFTSWQDNVTSNPRTITVTGNATYTAYFEQDTPSYHIDVVSADPTIGSTTGSGDYPLGTSVTITATPNTGYHFTQWLDENTDNPRTVVCEGNATYIAYFAQDLPTYHIDVVSADPTMGSATGSGDYAENSSVTISAIPNSGYHFTSWQDNVTSNPRTITVTGNATYTAYFESDGGGEQPSDNAPSIACVGVDMNGHNVVRWEQRQGVSAVRYNVYREGLGGYSIVGYVLNTGATEYSWVDDNSNTATQAYSYKISEVAANGMESDLSQPHTTMHLQISQGQGTTWNLSWTPYVGFNHSGYRIYRGTSSASMSLLTELSSSATTYSNNAPSGDVYYQIEVVASGAKSITATSRSNIATSVQNQQFTITVLSDNTSMGTVLGGGTFSEGTTATISATPLSGYAFLQWNDGSTQAQRTITVTGNATYTAYFTAGSSEPQQYLITVVSNNPDRGTVSGSGLYDAGAVITITAEPFAGFEFVQWQDGNTEDFRTITVTADATYTALFRTAMEGIDEVEATNDIKIYTRGNTIVIDFSGQQAAVSRQDIVVYDVMGRVIKQTADSGQQAAVEIPVTGAGVYMVKVGEHPSQKVVVR